METSEYSNINQGYTEVSPEVNSCPSPAITEQSNEHKREAICKRCGVIWHPYDTTTRRPTRCPYCRSRKTEWVDMHPELLALRDTGDNTEVETEYETWNTKDLPLELPSPSSEQDQYDAWGAEEDIDEEGSENLDCDRVSPRASPQATPENSSNYLAEKKQPTGIPITAVYLLLGAVLIYSVVRVWKTLSKPVPREEITVSTPQTVSMEKTHMGLAEMAMKRHHLL